MSNKHEYGSRFLYAEDLLIDGEFKTPVVEILEVHEPGTIKSANGRMIDKWTVGFRGKAKMLVLCKTNQSIIHILTGGVAGPGWVGKSVTIGARIIKAFGDECLAIRVIPPTGITLRKKLIEGLGRPAVFDRANNE